VHSRALERDLPRVASEEKGSRFLPVSGPGTRARRSGIYRDAGPKTALIFQPLFQGAVVLAIGVAILAVANAKAKSRGENFRLIAATLPVE
jgi:hypothetical protein